MAILFPSSVVIDGWVQWDAVAERFVFGERELIYHALSFEYATGTFGLVLVQMKLSEDLPTCSPRLDQGAIHFSSQIVGRSVGRCASVTCSSFELSHDFCDSIRVADGLSRVRSNTIIL